MPIRGTAVALTLTAAACTSVHRVQPAEFIPQHNPAWVSVWTARDDVTIVESPQIDGDTLTGLVFEQRWAMPLNEIARVEAHAPDTRRTALLIAGVAASAVGMAALLGGPTQVVPRPVCSDSDDPAC